MRTFIVSLSMLISSVIMASPSIQPAFNQVLLEVKSSGGYVPEEYLGWESGLRINMDGTIVGFKKRSARQPYVQTFLGTLSQTTISKIKEKTEALASDRNIIFPDQPICADAPKTTFSAPYRNLNFASKERCLTGILENSWQARSLMQLLDGLKQNTL